MKTGTDLVSVSQVSKELFDAQESHFVSCTIWIVQHVSHLISNGIWHSLNISVYKRNEESFIF